MQVDFTGVSSGFELIPEGDYRVAVFKVEQKMSKANKPYLNFTLKIQEGEGVHGRQMFYVASLQPQSLWSLKATLKALGYSDEELKGNFDLDTEGLIGRECMAVVIHEEYNGEMRDHVDKLYLIEGANTNSGVGLYR